MAIPLNPQGQSRPSLKLPTIGIGAELCMIGQRRRPKMEIGGQRQATTKDGKPREQLIITAIIVSTNGAVTGPEGQERPLQVGEIVDYYADGGNWWNFIEAERALATAGLTAQVGDVVLVQFTHTEPSSMPGGSPKKVRACTMRRAHPGEQHYVVQAEAAYYSLGFDRPDGAPAPIAMNAQPGPFDGGQQYPAQQAPQYPQQQASPAYQPQPAYAPQQVAPAPQYPQQQALQTAVPPYQPGPQTGF
jgi:hypothetical protein